MLQSIRNFAKGKLSKVLLVVLIIPFVLWGMGDVFRGGSQSTIATLNKKKISITDYINHFNSLNVNREFIIKNPETKIFEEALNKLVSGKVLVEEAKKIGIVVTEKSLSQIIKNDPTFLDNDKFSRTKYEKFLIERSISAVKFEKILKEETIKKLFVQLVMDGINSPKFLVENTYNVFNQEKKLEFINLDKIYKKNFSDEDINNFYLEKKDNFLQEFKKQRENASKSFKNVARGSGVRRQARTGPLGRPAGSEAARARAPCRSSPTVAPRALACAAAARPPRCTAAQADMLAPGGEGRRLQSLLEAKAASSSPSNYTSEWWERYGYHSARETLLPQVKAAVEDAILSALIGDNISKVDKESWHGMLNRSGRPRGGRLSRHTAHWSPASAFASAGVRRLHA